MIIPNRLTKGDTIGIVTPADCIWEDDIQYIEASTKYLNDRGYKVKFAKNALKDTLGYSLTAEEKAEDIHEMFLDNEVNAIFTMSGGENAFSCLSSIDYDIIKANPKIILGFSDIDTLTLAIYKKTGLITFNGTTFKSGFSKRYDEYSANEVFERLEAGRIGRINQTEPWSVLRKTSDSIVEGRLIGANVFIMSNLTGTEYMPDTNGAILCIEDLGFESMPASLSKSLHILNYHKVFDGLNGILVGNYEHESGIAIEDVLINEIIKDREIPIMKCNDFGHGTHHTVLPIGAMARMDMDNVCVEIIDQVVL